MGTFSARVRDENTGGRKVSSLHQHRLWNKGTALTPSYNRKLFLELQGGSLTWAWTAWRAPEIWTRETLTRLCLQLFSQTNCAVSFHKLPFYAKIKKKKSSEKGFKFAAESDLNGWDNSNPLVIPADMMKCVTTFVNRAENTGQPLLVYAPRSYDCHAGRAPACWPGVPSWRGSCGHTAPCWQEE